MSHRLLTLAPGSIVIERYEYETRRGTSGVQWLLQVVGKDGDLRLIQACKTRKAALAAGTEQSQ